MGRPDYAQLVADELCEGRRVNEIVGFDPMPEHEDGAPAEGGYSLRIGNEGYCYFSRREVRAIVREARALAKAARCAELFRAADACARR